MCPIDVPSLENYCVTQYTVVLKKHLLGKLTNQCVCACMCFCLPGKHDIISLMKGNFPYTTRETLPPFPTLNVAVGCGVGEKGLGSVCLMAESNASCVAISRETSYTKYTTCGLLRNDLVLRHSTDIHRRRQITDCLFRLPATIDKQPSSNMFIAILVYFQLLQDCETLLVGCLLSFLSCL